MAVKELTSTYVTGFCGIGSHENAPLISPSGKPLRACPVGGRLEATDGRGERVLGEIICVCACHDMSRQMEELSGTKFPIFSSRRASPALSRLGLLSPGANGTDGATAAGSVNVERPTVVVPSGARFAVTPTGRAARGQLEELVRHYVCQQVKAAGEDMIAMLGLTTQFLSLLIDKDSPPSTGAIHAVLKRWEGANYIDLAESPVRFVRFTERGKRELFR